MCIALWGDKTKDIENVSIGDPIKVSVNVESREFNGRWYTDVKAWRVETPSTGTSTQGGPLNVPSFDDFPPDLPFDQEENSEEIYPF